MRQFSSQVMFGFGDYVPDNLNDPMGGFFKPVDYWFYFLLGLLSPRTLI